ncbi:MAG: PglZ domain-containing protein [Asgard group archaeon]|nr:PglZ domain-containing protein [Asgard group archaeon]
MTLKNKKITLIIILSTIIISGTTLGIVLPLLLSDKQEASLLTIFTSSHDIISITDSEFISLTNSTKVISTYNLLENYDRENFEFLKIIAEIDQANVYSYEDLSNSSISLKTEGFQFELNSEIINNVQGIAIDIQYSTADITPTIYHYLSFNGWDTEGKIVELENTTNINKTLVILLDSFGWTFWTNLSSLGLVNFIIDPMFIQPALTTYPSISNVGAASILSGFWPKSTGITIRQDHQLLVDTIFDVGSKNNYITEYIEGNVGFLNLEADYEHWLTDLNADGNIDDEIYAEAQESIGQNRSDLLFVHFHGIDDSGHMYGPNSTEWLSKVIETFTIVNNLIDSVSNDTLIIITADHGMHLGTSNDDYRLGVHGECCFEDMVIPLIVIQK